jgi:hypothetical protein
MDWLISGIIGWCGTGWPRRFPGGGGGGRPDPEDPWPPNCPMCGGFVGALSAVVIYALVGGQLASAGFLGMAVTSFAAGSVGNSLVGGIVGRLRAK